MSRSVCGIIKAVCELYREQYTVRAEVTAGNWKLTGIFSWFVIYRYLYIYMYLEYANHKWKMLTIS